MKLLTQITLYLFWAALTAELVNAGVQSVVAKYKSERYRNRVEATVDIVMAVAPWLLSVVILALIFSAVGALANINTPFGLPTSTLVNWVLVGVMGSITLFVVRMVNEGMFSNRYSPRYVRIIHNVIWSSIILSGSAFLLSLMYNINMLFAKIV